MIKCIENCRFFEKTAFACTIYSVYLNSENGYPCRCKKCISDGNEWALEQQLKSVINILDGGKSK